MNTEATSEYFSVRELAGMALPNHPGSERAWLDLVAREAWPYREVKSRGRGGIRREYQPPPHVMELIHARQRGEIGPSDERGAIIGHTRKGAPRYLAEKQEESEAGHHLASTFRRVGAKSGLAYVNVHALAACLEQVEVILRESGRERSLPDRLDAAIRAYRVLGEVSKIDLLNVVAAANISHGTIKAAASLIISADNDSNEESSSVLIASFDVSREYPNADDQDVLV